MDSRYLNRTYRSWMTRGRLHAFTVAIGESDLLIRCDRELRDEARAELARVRAELEGYIVRDPAFRTTIEPHPLLPDAPPLARLMADAARPWSVGPMAAVAGAIARTVGRHLRECGAATIIVENGGDIFAFADRPVRLALYAGEESPFTGRVIFEVDARGGLGICTSSGTVGPSLSFGRADAVTAVAACPALADAAATALGNRILCERDVPAAVADGRVRQLLTGVIACLGDTIGLWGAVRLVGTGSEEGIEQEPEG